MAINLWLFWNEVGTESYSQARTPKSDYTDKDKEKSDKNTDDIESQAPQSSNIIDHIHQKGVKRANDPVIK